MRRLCTLLFLAGTLGLMLVGCQSGEKKRKTLFVIVDGVTVDNIERIAPATIFDIASVGGYSRGYDSWCWKKGYQRWNSIFHKKRSARDYYSKGA